jgi:hypothetical protein
MSVLLVHVHTHTHTHERTTRGLQSFDCCVCVVCDCILCRSNIHSLVLHSPKVRRNFRATSFAQAIECGLTYAHTQNYVVRTCVKRNQADVPGEAR